MTGTREKLAAPVMLVGGERRGVASVVNVQRVIDYGIIPEPKFFVGYVRVAAKPDEIARTRQGYAVGTAVRLLEQQFMGRAKVRYRRERIAGVINDTERIAASAIASNAGVSGNNRESATPAATRLHNPQKTGVCSVPPDYISVNRRVPNVQVLFANGVVSQPQRVSNGTVASERRRRMNRIASNYEIQLAVGVECYRDASLGVPDNSVRQRGVDGSGNVSCRWQCRSATGGKAHGPYHQLCRRFPPTPECAGQPRP